jgi:hypothetical protein
MRDNRAWLLVADQTSDAQATNVKLILLCDSLLGKTNCSKQAWLLKNSFLVPNSRNLGGAERGWSVRGSGRAGNGEE